MESKLGALWRKPKSERGPVAKGSLDFSRMEETDKARLHNAFVKGEKVFITMWQNRHEEGDKNPDLTITMDKPYTPGENVQHDAPKPQAAMAANVFDDDLPLTEENIPF